MTKFMTRGQATALAKMSSQPASVLEQPFYVDGLRFRMTYGGSHKSTTGISIKRFTSIQTAEKQFVQVAVLLMDDEPFLVTKTRAGALHPVEEFIVNPKLYLWWMISVKSDARDAIIHGILKLYKSMVSPDESAGTTPSKKDFALVLKAAKDAGFDGDELQAIKRSAKGI